MLSQGDLSGDLDILTLAKETIRLRDRKPGNVYLGLVHRLDRPVAGVMVLAKTSKAAGRLSKQFRSRTTRKRYRAVVTGVPDPNNGTLENYLLKDRGRRVTRVVGPGDGGKPAKLRYRVLGRDGDKSLVGVELITGLPHQIRAQLSAMGHPIVGDRKYGSRADHPRGTIALYSHSITLAHPVRTEKVTVEAEPPPGWPWED
jgi:23S rRNA pseudouridine1911/1915/1917 synthase